MSYKTIVNLAVDANPAAIVKANGVLELKYTHPRDQAD